MTDNKLTVSITTSTTQLDLEGKTVKQETIRSSSEIIEHSTEPNEKNGQKRIQPAPTDGASKKPRINTPEDSSVESEQEEQEMALRTEQIEQKMAIKNEHAEQEMVLNTEQVEQKMVLKNKHAEQEMVLNTEQAEQEMVLKNEHAEQEKVLNTEQVEEEMVLKNEQAEQEMVLNTEQAEQEMVIKTEEGEENMDQSNEREEYYLTIHNLPSDWTYMQIKDYLDQECGHVEEMEMLKHRRSKTCAIRLTFQSLDKCTEVFNKLKNKHVQDKKLYVKITDTYSTFPKGGTLPSTVRESLTKQFSIPNEVIAATRWRPDLDCWETDPEGLYGLRPEFLKFLNIEPPINKMVHVTNFRCDKIELREVMELAGNVLMCSVVYSMTKYAKVMYSHPLEAVQAISMLNGQLFYGTPLKITLDKNPADSVVLPKGLASIGQGLGIKAKPIRNIVQQYHRYAKKQSSLINPLVFSEIDFTNEHNIFKTKENTEAVEGKIKEFASSRLGSNILNPTVNVDNIEDTECPEPEESDINVPETSKASETKRRRRRSSQDTNKKGAEKQQSKSPQLAGPALRGAAPNPLVGLGNPSGGFIHPNLLMNPAGSMPIPLPCEPFFMPDNNLHQQDPRPFGPRVPFMQRPPFPQIRPPFGPPGAMRPQIPPNFNGPRPLGNPVTLKFTNLPPSTTFPLLCELLAKCGQVMSVQLTTPGCAVATFGHPSHADRCFQLFNGKNVDGHLIEVFRI